MVVVGTLGAPLDAVGLRVDPEPGVALDLLPVGHLRGGVHLLAVAGFRRGHPGEVIGQVADLGQVVEQRCFVGVHRRSCLKVTHGEVLLITNQSGGADGRAGPNCDRVRTRPMPRSTGA